MAENDQPYIQLLNTATHIQLNVALMLEAKAEEAEKLRNWICNHIDAQSFSDNDTKLQQALSMHDQVISMVEGITRMNQSLVGIMSAVIQNQNEGETSGGTEDFFTEESAR